MKRRKWIRLDIDYDRAEWMDPLPDHVRRLWPHLNCWVKAWGTRGAFARQSPQAMGRELRCDPAEWSLLLDAALARGAIAIDDMGRYQIAEWQEKQEIDMSTQRVQRHRMRQSEDVTE